MTLFVVDLYAGVGAASKGYSDAGADVEGIDVVDQPNYPFAFHRGDALGVLVRMVQQALAGETVTFGGRRVDLVHASPPCQASTALTKGTNRGRTYPQLIPVTRELLKLTGLPFVIENVQGSAVRRDLTLCGEMFGLDVIRHRYFEIEGVDVTEPKHVPHRGRVQGWRHGVYHDGPYFAVYGDGGGKGTVAQWRKAMGIDWTDDRKELAEAIPPAYTEFIGRQLIEHLAERAA